MDLDLVFLGTSASMPTAQRAPAALLVRRGGERLLFDCAEGTQRQLQRSSVGLVDLEEIFLTHLHGDHILGLPGMVKTFALRGRDGLELTVYGPRGVRELFTALRPLIGRLPYPLRVVELDVGRPSIAATTNSRRSPSITASPQSATPSSSTNGRAGSTSRRPMRSESRRDGSAACSSAAGP